MSTDPWTDGVLPRKEVELVGLAINAACTNLDAEGTRRHIRGALDAGASREEILMVLKMASLLAIHTCSLGAPILIEEAKTAGVTPRAKTAATPVCDRMRGAFERLTLGKKENGAVQHPLHLCAVEPSDEVEETLYSTGVTRNSRAIAVGISARAPASASSDVRMASSALPGLG